MLNQVKGFFPTTKLWAILLLFILIATIPGIKFQYSLLLVIFVLSMITRDFVSLFKKFMKSAFVLCLIIFLIQGIFYPGEEVVFKIFTKEGVSGALFLISKIAPVTLILLYFFETTKIKDLVASLERIGLNKKVIYVVISTLQIIPQMSEELKTIKQAQNSRGIDTDGNLFNRLKTIIPLFTPLVLGSLERTEEQVLTLEARAFSSMSKKTMLYEITPRPIDLVAKVLVIVITVAYVVLVLF